MALHNVDISTNSFMVSHHFTAARIGADGKGGHAITRSTLEAAVAEATRDGFMDANEKAAIERNVGNLAGYAGRTLMSDDARRYYAELQRAYGLENPTLGFEARNVNEAFQRAQRGDVGQFWLTKAEIQVIFASAVRYSPLGQPYIPDEAKQAIVDNLGSWTLSAGAAWGGIVAEDDALDEYLKLSKRYELPKVTMNGTVFE